MGLGPSQSAIVKISQDQVELFRSNGLAEASVGDSVSFLVKLDSRQEKKGRRSARRCQRGAVYP